jgi:hypothetical protein
MRAAQFLALCVPKNFPGTISTQTKNAEMLPNQASPNHLEFKHLGSEINHQRELVARKNDTQGPVLRVLSWHKPKSRRGSVRYPT